MALKERLRSVPGLVRIVRALRRPRLSASRAGRHRRIDSYLRTHSIRKLQLGSGDNVLAGWLNTDVYVFKQAKELVHLDARKPFPLPDASFDLVFSEHMLEHLTYGEGLHCLRECHRVLRPGGRIRVATPSLGRLAGLYRPDATELERRYVRWSIDSFVADAGAYLPGFVLNNFFRAWGHQFIYDAQTLGHALETAGFVEVEEWTVGQSGHPELTGLERHLRGAAEFNEFETMVLEARRL
jgi:predicted SAM-dependent methyltransferase